MSEQTNKIFFIGMNKTGTTTFQRLLRNNGVTCQHGPKWVRKGMKGGLDFIDDGARGWSDGPVYLHGFVESLVERFPDCYLFYQTRSLRQWLISRHYHVALNKAKGKQTWNNSPADVVAWILRRNQHVEGLHRMEHTVQSLSLWTSDEDFLIRSLEAACGMKFTDRKIPVTNSHEFTISSLQKNGFDTPILKASEKIVDQILSALSVTDTASEHEVDLDMEAALGIIQSSPTHVAIG